MSDEFLDAPPSVATACGGPFPRYVAFFDELRENPGKWKQMPATFKSANSAGGAAIRVKRGVYTGTEPGEFDAVSRTVDGKTLVYASYIGEAST